MGFNSNSSDKQVLGGLYTGLCSVRIVAINPTMEEIKAMGINATKEPEYKTQTDTGENKMRIDFYLASAVTGVNLSKSLKQSFWLEDRIRVNKDKTKEEWINKYGVSTWGKAIDVAPEYDWLLKDGLRKAFVGEVDLTNFIKAWANVDPKDQATFDDIKKLTSGDLTELMGLYNTIKLNQVKVLLGVKEGKYQAVYPKYFERNYRTGFTAWKKALEGEYGEFKDGDYQKDLNLKPYVGTSTVEGDSPTPMEVPAGAQPAYKF